MEVKRKKTGIIIVAILAGLVVGGVGGYVLKGIWNAKPAANESTKADARTDGVTVGDFKLVRSKDVVENIGSAGELSTLEELLTAADFAPTLKAAGPFTVFAPNNEAFAKLTPEAVDNLKKPENLEQLKAMLNSHVVPGVYTGAELRVMAEKGESFTTLQGGVLAPIAEGEVIKIKDAKGAVTGIAIADAVSSNGVVHVIDTSFNP